MVDSILASANRVPRVLLAHAKNTTRVLRGPIRLLACTHPTPREFFFTCPRMVLYFTYVHAMLENIYYMYLVVCYSTLQHDQQ